MGTALLLLLWVAGIAGAQPGGVKATQDISFRNEVERAITRGLDWLQRNQNSNGYWSTPDQPAMSALSLMAFKGEPARRFTNEPPWMKKGYAYIVNSAKPDGGIHQGNLVTYNTSISVMALLAADQKEYEPLIRNARRFLIGLQSDFKEKGETDPVFDGGIGYGSKYLHSDMANTLAALEAIYYTRQLADDASHKGAADLNWEAAIHFIQNCQNLPTYNTQQWVSADSKNKGGFVYFPGQSMAGADTNAATGHVALRSYGSMSYAGLLSYIYASLRRDDPRVWAVFDWLRQNYTLSENPGLGPQGLFYYFHTMTKALTIYGVDELELSGGRRIQWRHELALKLLDLQQKDGSWSNDNGRWWEKDPVLVTPYAVLSLEMIYRGL
jgi:squalene-hopene/tetraprenyl-beta-curcumene cyclase